MRGQRDAVASLLAGLGFRNYLVEIGGELRGSGTNEQGAAWRVAVERPVPWRGAAQRIAARCALADARSTALNVLGPDEGYALAVERGWAALFVADDGSGRLVEQETPAFTAAVRR